MQLLMLLFPYCNGDNCFFPFLSASQRLQGSIFQYIVTSFQIPFTY